MAKSLLPIVDGFPDQLLDPEWGHIFNLVPNEKVLATGEATYRREATSMRGPVPHTLIVARLSSGEFVITENNRGPR